jgi:hypothetical protein
MTEPNKELAELRSYVQYLKLDREEEKRKEAREGWTKWVSLSIVFLAVAAALANQQQGSFSGRSVSGLNQAAIEQGLASNQWSYYQANSIKLHLYEFEKERRAARDKGASLLTVGLPNPRGGLVRSFLDKKIAKYQGKKKETMAKAREHEQNRDGHRQASHGAQRHKKELSLALAVLQVAIAVASISLLAKKKPLWFVSLAIGVFGVFQTFNGIFLWV